MIDEFESVSMCVCVSVCMSVVVHVYGRQGTVTLVLFYNKLSYNFFLNILIN